jgi:RES domain-containing protein
MFVYRICRRPHTSLDGEGARLWGGRWNSPGKPAVYTSAHLSLAALEYFVHVDPSILPVDLVWMKIQIEDDCSTEIFTGKVAPDPSTAASYGDDWLTAKRSLILMVPSVVLAVELNVIINPAHVEMSCVKTADVSPFEFDGRIFK